MLQLHGFLALIPLASIIVLGGGGGGGGCLVVVVVIKVEEELLHVGVKAPSAPIDTIVPGDSRGALELTDTVLLPPASLKFPSKLLKHCIGIITTDLFDVNCWVLLLLRILLPETGIRTHCCLAA